MNARVIVQHNGELGQVFHVIDSDGGEICSSADAQKLRPLCLIQLGYVPEPVLEFCNRARNTI